MHIISAMKEIKKQNMGHRQNQRNLVEKHTFLEKQLH